MWKTRPNEEWAAISGTFRMREEAAKAMETNAPVHMLDGYKVLDFTQAVAGPTATLMLAEMGAEVIKVELAPNGDPTRAIPLVKSERSGYFVQTQSPGDNAAGLSADIEELRKRNGYRQGDVLKFNTRERPGIFRRIGI